MKLLTPLRIARTMPLLAAAATALLFGTLSADAERTQVAAVGPRPAGEHYGAPEGYLKVYSATEEHPNGEGSYAYVHSIYRIFTADGKKLRQVINHDNPADELPEKVALMPGVYTVVADSEHDGVVSVPVVIKRAQTTNVYLDGSRPADTGINPTRATRTPSGSVIGWQASQR